MKTMLLVVALLVIAAVAVGFYRGWFTLSSQSDEGGRSATLSVDTDKIKADRDKVLDQAQEPE